MTKGALLRTARQEAREQVWRTLTDELAKDGRALRPSFGRIASSYLKFVAASSLGIALGILTTAMIYLIQVVVFHLDLS